MKSNASSSSSSFLVHSLWQKSVMVSSTSAANAATSCLSFVDISKDDIFLLNASFSFLLVSFSFSLSILSFIVLISSVLEAISFLVFSNASVLSS